MHTPYLCIIYLFVCFNAWFHYIVQAGPELLGLSDPSTLALILALNHVHLTVPNVLLKSSDNHGNQQGYWGLKRSLER